MTKYFRVIARAVPHETVIRGYDADNEDCYTEFLPGELKGLEVVGMPVRFNHNEKTFVGHVVEKMMSPKDAMLVRIEIPFDDDVNTERGKRRHEAKQNIVHLIEEGYIEDVSLTHYFNEKEAGDKSMVVIEKRPVELSLVVKGERSGSSIISSSEWADKPFLNEKEYKQFAPENSKCRSVIDFLAQEPLDIFAAEPQQLEEKEKEQTPERTENPISETKDTMSDKRDSVSKDDFDTINKKYNELKETLEKERREKEELAPLAEKYKAAQSKREAEVKDNFKRHFSSIFDVTEQLLGEDEKEKEDEPEKKRIKEEMEGISADKKEVMSYLDTFLGEKKGDPAQIEAYEKMDGFLGKAAPTMVKCSQYLQDQKKKIAEERKEINKLRAEMASKSHSNLVSEPPKGKAPAHMDTNSWVQNFKQRSAKIARDSNVFEIPESRPYGW